MTLDSDQTVTSKQRLMRTAKSLFAHNGYEATSTASIARGAMTSESQLVRYFGGKAGLLEAIFNRSWQALNPLIHEKVVGATSARQALLTVLEILMNQFENDQELAVIFLFEGRRIRGAEHEVFISKGFVKFNQLIRTLVQRGKAEGRIRPDLKDGALAAALIGAAEGMVRERLIAQRLGDEPPFEISDLAAVVDALLGGLSG